MDRWKTSRINGKLEHAGCVIRKRCHWFQSIISIWARHRKYVYPAWIKCSILFIIAATKMRRIGKCKRCKSKKVRLVPGLGIDLCVTCANELGYELAHNEWNARGLTRCILCGVNHACSKSFGRVCASCATTLYKVAQAEQHDRFREPKEVLYEIKDLAIETREKLAHMVNEKYPLSPHNLDQIEDEFVYQLKTRGKN